MASRASRRWHTSAHHAVLGPAVTGNLAALARFNPRDLRLAECAVARPPAEIRASYFDEDLVDLPNRVLDVAESRRCIALLKRRSMGKTLVDQVAYLGFGLLPSRDVTGHICRGDVVDEHDNGAHGR